MKGGSVFRQEELKPPFMDESRAKQLGHESGLFRVGVQALEWVGVRAHVVQFLPPAVPLHSGILRGSERVPPAHEVHHEDLVSLLNRPRAAGEHGEERTPVEAGPASAREVP